MSDAQTKTLAATSSATIGDGDDVAGAPARRADAVRVIVLATWPEQHVRAECRRCGWHGRTRRFCLVLTDDALARHARSRLAEDMNGHCCDERVIALARAIRAQPGDPLSDGLEAVISAVLNCQDSDLTASTKLRSEQEQR